MVPRFFFFFLIPHFFPLAFHTTSNSVNKFFICSCIRMVLHFYWNVLHNQGDNWNIRVCGAGVSLFEVHNKLPV